MFVRPPDLSHAGERFKTDPRQRPPACPHNEVTLLQQGPSPMSDSPRRGLRTRWGRCASRRDAWHRPEHIRACRKPVRLRRGHGTDRHARSCTLPFPRDRRWRMSGGHRPVGRRPANTAPCRLADAALAGEGAALRRPRRYRPPALPGAAMRQTLAARRSPRQAASSPPHLSPARQTWRIADPRHSGGECNPSLQIDPLETVTPRHSCWPMPGPALADDLCWRRVYRSAALGVPRAACGRSLATITFPCNKFRVRAFATRRAARFGRPFPDSVNL